MYTSEIIPENGGRAQKVCLFDGQTQLSFGNVLRLWQNDHPFRTFFLQILFNAPYQAYRWETPPVTAATLQRPFEFMLLDSPSLSASADPAAFREFLTKSPGEDVVVFPNLGRDAILIAPTPKLSHNTYAHLASFSHHAAASQQHAFWQKVGETMEKHVGAKPVWLNTAGAGVAWLHVRLDSSPKYYRHAGYRSSS